MGRRVESESESLRRRRMKKLFLRTLLAILAGMVGVVTMPLWPVIFAAVIWNGIDDEDEEGK